MESTRAISHYIMDSTYQGPTSEMCILPFELIGHIFSLLQANNLKEMQALACVSKQCQWLANAGRRSVYGDETKAFGKQQALRHFNVHRHFETAVGYQNFYKNLVDSIGLKDYFNSTLENESSYQEFVSLPLTCDKILKSACPIFSSQDSPKTVAQTHTRFIRIFKGLDFDILKTFGYSNPFKSLGKEHLFFNKATKPINTAHWALMTMDLLPQSLEHAPESHLSLHKKINKSCYFSYTVPKGVAAAYCILVEYTLNKKYSRKKFHREIKCQDGIYVGQVPLQIPFPSGEKTAFLSAADFPPAGSFGCAGVLEF